MAVSYDKNTDYQALINKSVAGGDYASAAKYEQQRNAKITGEGLSFATTNNYGDYLPSSSYINSMYDSQKEGTLSQLEAAYNKNVNTLNNTASKIPQQYYEQKREAEGNAAIQRKNMNEVFNANGLNTGAIGQANLAMSNQNSANLSKLNAAQANAQSEVDLQRANLETDYKSAVAKAISDSDFNRAQALYSDYQQKQSTAKSQVDALLKMGIKPSDALVAQSGYSTDYVNSIYNAYMAQTAYSGGGSGRSSKNPKDASSPTEPSSSPTTSNAFYNQYAQNSAAVAASKSMDSKTRTAYADALSKSGAISSNTAKAIKSNTSAPTFSSKSGLQYITSSLSKK